MNEINLREAIQELRRRADAGEVSDPDLARLWAQLLSALDSINRNIDVLHERVSRLEQQAQSR